MYTTYLNGFDFWMKTLNFSPATISSSMNKTNDFLNWLIQNNINNIQSVKDEAVQEYFKHLHNRPNKHFSGGLSDNYIRAHYNSLRRFSKYLLNTHNIGLKVEVNLPKIKITKTILTQNEVKSLFDNTSDDVLGLRDKAMLAVYYSCGLRRSEGLALNTSDIDTTKQRLFIRKGKGLKERFTPFNQYTANIFDEYLNYSRPYLNHHQNDAFFLSSNGNRITGTAMTERLKKLLDTAGVDKAISLHSLRSSIATHLLQNGLNLNRVKVFLGHKSIESTEIYTIIDGFEIE